MRVILKLFLSTTVCSKFTISAEEISKRSFPTLGLPQQKQLAIENIANSLKFS
jgi:hypothetical protein